MITKKEVKALKGTFKTRFEKISPDLVNKALNSLEAISEKEIAELIQVHPTTLKDWRSGKNEPNGANKVVINYLLFINRLKGQNEQG